MQGKVVIITGAAQGIGKATARAFLDAGAAVVIGDVEAELSEQTVRELSAFGDIQSVTTDVAVPDHIERLVNETLARHGRIDIVINNAGIARNRPLTELTLEQWREVVDVNLTAAFLMAKHAAPSLMKAGGSIIHIASTRAHMSTPRSEAYAATKSGLIGLTHALALSLGPAVRVNCISPGWVRTREVRTDGTPRPPLTEIAHKQHPVGRVGRPEDIAQLAVYLCSDAAGFITGQDFIVDGGMTRKMIYER